MVTNNPITQGDHTLLVQISTQLARLESKVDALVQRIDALDRRLEDHEARLRAVEAADLVTVDELAARDLELKKSRRWLIGIAVTIGLGVGAELITIAIALLN